VSLTVRWRALGRDWRASLARPQSLAIPLRFDVPGVRHFGAPPATSTALRIGEFSGDVRTGASCNCATLTLTPHCHGTHTECVGHLIAERIHVRELAPRAPLPALVLSTPATRATDCTETSRPRPAPDDALITRAGLLEALRAVEAHLPAAPTPGGEPPLAMVIRTLPNDAAKLTRDYSDGSAPFLTLEAVEWLIERGTRHLVLDLPSLDRSHDDGELAGHRAFFGLPARGVSGRADPVRHGCTITELAFVPDDVADGVALLQLALPEIDGDAVPSAPLLYAAESA
jgi:kynurenine formamidase